MNGNIKVVSGPSIERTGDLAAYFSNLSPGDILFIDEIHRLPRIVEEVLYSAMEDFYISVIVGKEGCIKSTNIDLAPFTLVGATTRVVIYLQLLEIGLELLINLNIIQHRNLLV